MSFALPREAWQDPAKPVTGPRPKGDPHTWVIHYPGSPGDAPMGDQVPVFLRNVQAAYLASRKYSIGYSYGVAQDGTRWEIRGEDFNPASNPGRKVEGNFNNVSRSIFVMVKGDDPATPAAVAAINSIIATQPGWDVITHGDVDYTSCCGTGLIGQVRDGTIGQHTAPEPPPVIPPKDAPEMFFFVVTNEPGNTVAETYLLCDGTQLSHVKDGHAAAVYASAGVEVVRSGGALQTEGLIKSCKTMTTAPPEWGAAWTDLWNRHG